MLTILAGEHAIIYQYYLNNAKNHYMGLIQTETVRLNSSNDVLAAVHVSWCHLLQPYFQPNPVPPAPFITNTAYKDPAIGPGAAWALTVTNSQNILVYGTSSDAPIALPHSH